MIMSEVRNLSIFVAAARCTVITCLPAIVRLQARVHPGDPYLTRVKRRQFAMWLPCT